MWKLDREILQKMIDQVLRENRCLSDGLIGDKHLVYYLGRHIKSGGMGVYAVKGYNTEPCHFLAGMRWRRRCFSRCPLGLWALLKECFYDLIACKLYKQAYPNHFVHVPICFSMKLVAPH